MIAKDFHLLSIKTIPVFTHSMLVCPIAFEPLKTGLSMKTAKMVNAELNLKAYTSVTYCFILNQLCSYTRQSAKIVSLSKYSILGY